MPQFQAQVALTCTPEQVFEFLIRPANALMISPPETALNYVDVPEVLELGSRLEFDLGGFGPPQRITHEVTVFESPRLFTESQVTGPLEKWVHQHIVEVHEQGAQLTDLIEFEPPGGMIGFLVTADRIHESLQTGFAHRHEEMKKMLEQADG